MALLYIFVKALAQPYLWLLVAAAWLCFRRGRDPDARGWGTMKFLLLVLALLSIPATSMMIARSLEYPYLDATAEDAKDVDAIVVLGGGSTPPNRMRDYAVVTSTSFERCLHAADLFEQYQCDIILAGGATDANVDPTTEAAVMQRAMISLGIPRERLILEERSLDTSQNAKYVTEYLDAQKLNRVLLVTHARHIPRAMACFKNYERVPIPAPCCFESVDFDGEWFEMFIPSAGGLRGSQKGIHEWIGMAYYWATGKI